ncbi:hypothetical protein CN473_12315 [Bacillus thuringiensis]|uniref:hypothetical protein n=1 Tax=Bacillus thuringiensis TaxID=1428 RepID=UPI000BF9FC06|nr:hypothetical protein [Bacillus thuringiensis]PEQ53101.1 hypothetical protein CN473_12315 [Bacillus thuringiensis]
MKNLELIKRKELNLLDQYYSGAINAEEFAQKLFNSNDADRVRKKVVKKREQINNSIERELLKV